MNLTKLLFAVLVIFAMIGVGATCLGIYDIYLTDQSEIAYECNCVKIKEGMTVQDVRRIMTKGINPINARGFDYGFYLTKDDRFNSFTMNYNTSAGSFVAVIQFDPKTGRVIKSDCPPILNECD